MLNLAGKTKPCLPVFLAGVILTLPFAPARPLYAQGLADLPLPVLSTGTAAGPVLMQGVNIHPDNPLKFDFIFDPGGADENGGAFREESLRVIRYFLAALTIPENQMWVNLSPYEKDRIIPESFGKTEMGRDLLEQDYTLKQLFASMLNPDSETGGAFWERVNRRALEEFGTVDIPLNTYNKVWIVPEAAEIYEHERGAVIAGSRLKVMLEEDYLALNISKDNKEHGLGEVGVEDMHGISREQARVIKEILIPELEREVNEGGHFVRLRQIYHAMLLAVWYKSTLKDSLLGRLYVDKEKLEGVDNGDPATREKIYARYLQAFRQGAFDVVKSEYDPASREVIGKKYFSGGVALDRAMLVKTDTAGRFLDKMKHSVAVTAELGSVGGISRNTDIQTETIGFAFGSLPEAMRRDIGRVFDAVSEDSLPFMLAGFLAPYLELRKEFLGFINDEQYRLFITSDDDAAQIEIGRLRNMLVGIARYNRPTTSFNRNNLARRLRGFLDGLIPEKVANDDFAITIKSLGVASGEEPYSAAFALYYSLRDYHRRNAASINQSFDDWLGRWDIAIEGYDYLMVNLLLMYEGRFDQDSDSDDFGPGPYRNMPELSDPAIWEAPQPDPRGVGFAWRTPVIERLRRDGDKLNLPYRVRDFIRAWMVPVYADLMTDEGLDTVTRTEADVIIASYLDGTIRIPADIEQTLVSAFKPGNRGFLMAGGDTFDQVIEPSADRAMMGSAENVGGIDLNPAFADFNVRRQGRGLYAEMFRSKEGITSVDGFTPSIINIAPIPSLPRMIGVYKQ